MQSLLDPSVLYTGLSRDIVEHDVDVVSDLWNMDGREVYRGSRDRQYAHANVYWLYNEDLERIGLIEHSLQDNADFRLLWFYDTRFATFFQEEWVTKGSLWEILPRTAVERFIHEEWTTPDTLLSACLYGSLRIVNIDHVLQRPTIHSCAECGWKSLKKLPCGDLEAPLDFPNKAKILFIDDDLYVCQPPANSKVWGLLGFTLPPQPRDDEPALQEQVLEQQELEQESSHPQTPSLPEPHPEHSSPQEAEQQ